LVCLTVLTWHFATGAEGNHKRPVRMPNLRTKNLVWLPKTYPYSSFVWWLHGYPGNAEITT